MSDIADIIAELALPYELEYAVINLDYEALFTAQKYFCDFLMERKSANHITNLESESIMDRVYTDNILPNAKSMIVILFPYMTDLHDKNSNLSLYCMGEDYHIYVKKYLSFIADKLKIVDKNADFYIQVDTGTLNERFFAFYSGIGLLGINSMIISRKYGTYINIGLIVTDLHINELRYEQGYCDKCMACVNACPGSAINGDFSINSVKCASYISQKKGELSDDEQRILRKSAKVFGCDICQNVCHFNKNAKIVEPSYDIIRGISFSDIDNLSNKKFREKYRDRAFSFRGKSVIERNMRCLGEDIE